MRKSIEAPVTERAPQIFWFSVLVLFAFVVRAWTVEYAAPWWDEMHSLVYVQNNAGHLVDFRRTTDIHPPLYFLSLKGWFSLFGETREAARYFSVVVGTGCVAMVFIIARQLFPLRVAILSTLFIATFPTAVHYAREIRMYPQFTLLFLISLYFFIELVRALRDDEVSSSWRNLGFAGWILFLALTFYTHYTSALLFVLYTLCALVLLIRGDRRSFFWIVAGLAIATVLTLPQVYHLLTSSLGDPRKDWMEPTTLTLFYQTTLGAFDYPAALKLVILFTITAGGLLMLLRDTEPAILLAIFSAGGICLAAVIGIIEPIYLVRTIQIFTFAMAIYVGYLIAWLPARIGVGAIVILAAINLTTVVRNAYLPDRELMGMEAMSPLLRLTEPDKDQIFVKDYLYLRREAQFLSLDIYDHAEPLSLEGVAQEPDKIDAALNACFAAQTNGCRSVIVIIEQEARFDKEASDQWNAYVTDVKNRFPGNTTEFSGGKLRGLVVSQDDDFLKRTDAALHGGMDGGV